MTIAAAGKTDSRTIVVEEDPRVQFSADDRAKRRQAINTLGVLAKQADDSRKKAAAMNTALTNLTESWKQPNAPAVPDSIRKAADDILARVKAAASVFENVGGGRGGGGGAGPALTYVAPPVTQKISRLLSSIDSYSSAPTARQLADMKQAAAQLKKGAADVDALWDEVPKLNKMMLEAGVPYFKVDLTTAPPAAPGRGGN